MTQHAFVAFCQSVISLTPVPFPVLPLRIEDVDRRQSQRENQESHIDCMSCCVLRSISCWSVVVQKQN